MKMDDFQTDVRTWCIQCFGEDVTNDVGERTHRFFEEAAELCQSLGMSRHDADILLDYVYARPVGEPRQEIGGTMVTLAALTSAAGIGLEDAGVTELVRVQGKIEAIRAKHATKPRGTPLPGKAPEETKEAPQVTLFPRTSLNDLPQKLRELATRLETPGDEVYGADSILIAIPQTDDYPIIIGFGDQTNDNHPVVIATQIVHWMTANLTRRG